MFSKSASSMIVAVFMFLVAFIGCIEDPGLEPVENGYMVDNYRYD